MSGAQSEAEPDWFVLVTGLLGSMSLFLYGLKKITVALKAGAGDSLRRVLRRMCANPVYGLLTGTGVTAILSSSSAASVMVVTFVESGYISFQQALPALLGVTLPRPPISCLILLLFSSHLPILSLPDPYPPPQVLTSAQR
jgi:phosphate:Na+ symporter